MKGPNLQKIWDELPEERKQAIQSRTEELLAEYETLQELRKALEVSQCDMAKRLDVHQVNISKIENRQNIKISTLQDYLAALGGSLKIVVDFPEGRSVIIKGFSEETP